MRMKKIERAIAKDRFVYVHDARDSVSLNDTRLQTGDAASLTGEAHVILDQGEKAEVIVFELR